MFEEYLFRNPYMYLYHQFPSEHHISPLKSFKTIKIKCSKSSTLIQILLLWAMISSHLFTHVAASHSACPTGSKYYGGTCIPCPRGQYQDIPGQTSCKPCPHGTTTTGTGSSAKADCIHVCEAGSFWNPEAYLCLPCPKGQYQDQPGQPSCLPCPKGQYQDQPGQSSCFPCPDGKTTPSEGATSPDKCTPDGCGPGHMRVSSTGGCRPCPKGWYESRPNQTTCKRCPVGTTTPSEGSTTKDQCKSTCKVGEYLFGRECVPCKRGTYQDEPQEITCKPCPDKTSTKTRGATNQHECSECAPGYVHGDTGCKPCPVSSYRAENAPDCRPCPPGFTTARQGRYKSYHCYPLCDPGTRWDRGSGSCVPCPIRQYQDLPNRYRCKLCPDGKTTFTVGASRVSDCVDVCPAGKMMPKNGTVPADCAPCPAGTFKSDSMDTCRRCSSKAETTEPGATSQRDCQYRCGPGLFYSHAHDDCMSCFPGSYTDKRGLLRCTRCPPGQTTLRVGSKSAEECVVECGKGHQRVSVNGQDTCQPCPRGTYQPRDNCLSCLPCKQFEVTRGASSKSADDCFDPCESGYELVSRDPDVCAICPVNTYRKKNRDPKCIRCPLGSTTDQSGAKSKDECTVHCHAGYFEQYGTCHKCPQGTYQPQTEQTTCLPCLPGQTTSHTGSVSEDECISICDPGSFWSAAQRKCVLCPEGKYQDKPGQNQCELCPVGTRTNRPGADSAQDCIVSCGPGYFLDRRRYDHATCTKCPVDSYQDRPNQDSCKPCPRGTGTDITGATRRQDCQVSCKPGYYLRGEKCVPCGLGTYQPRAGQTSCYPCEGYKTTQKIASNSKNDCIGTRTPCTAGSFWGVFQCFPCPVGQYQDQPGQNACKPCPPGRTTVDRGCTDQVECIVQCSTGYYWSAESHGCAPCPLGTYQDEPNQSSCKDCPHGTTTLYVGTPSPHYCKGCESGRQYNPVSRKCEVCPPNTFWDKTSCVSCPHGYARKPGAYDCEPPCEPGTFWDVNRKLCLPCPTGQYQDSAGQQSCRHCPYGQTTEHGGAKTVYECIDIPGCPPGTFKTPGTSVCDPCPSGSYQDRPDMTYCNACPDGLHTATPGAKSREDCQECPPGQQYSWDSSGCEPCPVDFYRETGQGQCQPCQHGFITEANGCGEESLCLPPCPAGRYWDSHYEDCRPCPIGQYQDRKYQTSCISCPHGQTTDAVGAASKDKCKEERDEDCPPGKFLDHASYTCRPCPVNSYKDRNGQDSCTPCGYGKFTSEPGCTSSKQCKECPLGKQFDESIHECEPCPVNQYRDAGHYKCLPCPYGLHTPAVGSTVCAPSCEAGVYWLRALQLCLKCPKGTYQDEPYRDSCKPCPAGRITRTPGATSVTHCIDHAACGKGNYREGGECRPCPVGTYQSREEMTYCVACPQGYITPNTGANTYQDCIECPGGEERRYGETRCTPCPKNKYRSPGEPSCHPCPDGHITLKTGCHSVELCLPPCEKGQFWDNHVCKLCPVGAYQDKPYQKSCKPCPHDKTTHSEGSTNIYDCINAPPPTCPVGSFLDVSSKTCKKCPVGKYQDQTGQTSCTQCPYGQTTAHPGADGSNDCRPCDAGYYYIPGHDGCDPCPQNTYCESGQTQCNPCPSGYITLHTGTGYKTDCLPPCGKGQFWDSMYGLCRPCTIGKYQNKPNQVKCVDCPHGKTTASEGATHLYDCIDKPPPDCPKGSFLDYSTKTCKKCPVGTYQDETGQTICKPCPDGKTTRYPGADNEHDCKSCDAGNYYIPGHDGCDPCPQNTYCESGQTQCNPCPSGYITLHTGTGYKTDCLPPCDRGHHWDPSVKICRPCPVGRYQNKPHQLSCDECPYGKTTEHEGSTTIYDCTDLPPPDCPKGSFLDVLSNKCRECPVATYQDQQGQTTCKPCPEGKITPHPGADSITDCKACSSGYYYIPGHDGCDPCPKNTYCESGQTQCYPCPSSYITLHTGTGHKTDCLSPCERGQFWDSVYKICRPCAVGKFQDKPHQEHCQDCPHGKTTKHEGSTIIYDCIDLPPRSCLKGHYLDASTDSCKQCPLGTYQDVLGKTSCIPCPDGTTTPFPGASSADHCKPCEPGYYYIPGHDGCDACPKNTYCESGQTQCYPCPSGYITLHTGTGYKTDCLLPCDKGQFWDDSVKLCRPCPVGTYQDKPHQELCEHCPDGKRTEQEASISVFDCKKKPPPSCPVGSFLDLPSKECRKCPVGTFQDQSVQTVCKPCPAGKTTSSPGADSLHDCKPCDAGYYYIPGHDGCDPCPQNTYCESGQTQCNPCPSGYITLHTGTAYKTDCLPPCDRGHHWDPSVKICRPCPVGRYQDKPHQLSCDECPYGKTTEHEGSTLIYDCTDVPPPECPTGSFLDLSTKQCKKCPVGSYQDQKGQASCKPCPEGKLTPHPGADRITDCKACDPGYYYIPGHDGCDPCPKNTYCESGQTQCYPCPSGYITLHTGTGYKTDCFPPCLEGHFWDSAFHICRPCPVGKYQDKPYQKKCLDCPHGTSTDGEGKNSLLDCHGIVTGRPVPNCPKGTFTDAHNNCQKCDPGFYQDLPYQRFCKPCPQGTTTLNPGADRVTNCKTIGNCDKGHFYDHHLYTCTPCPLGTYQDEPGKESCKPCPYGKTTHQTGTYAPAGCISTSTTKPAGACDKGHYFDHHLYTCNPCPLGTYQDESGRESCKPCPNGQTTQQTGTYGLAGCTPPNCESGYEWNDGKCTPCGYGSYRNKNLHIRCQRCAYGYKTLSQFSKDVKDCVPSVAITPPDEELCTMALDLVLVVDLSRMVGPRTVHILREYLIQLLKKFKISKTNVRVGILQYARGVNAVVELKHGTNIQTVISKITKNFKTSRYPTVNTARALNAAWKMLQKQGFASCAKHVLLVTDEKADNSRTDLYSAAGLIKREAKLSVIGIPVMLNLASDPSLAFQISSYTTLPNVHTVANKICSQDTVHRG